jgi:phosphoribosylpyrophosphate synthetase
MSDNPLAIMVRDAVDTLARMKADATHLRELSRRARVAAAAAHEVFRAKVDETLERVADGVLELERSYERLTRKEP